MKEINRRDILKASIIGVASLFTGAVFLPKLADGKVHKKTDSLNSGVQYKADFTTTPRQLGFTSRLEIPPDGGWKESTYYVVDSSYSIDNPITRRIFYTGFEKFGKTNFCNYVCTTFPKDDISKWYYTKAIREINIFEGIKIQNLYRSEFNG